MPAFSSIDGLGDKAAELIEDEASKGEFLSQEDFKTRCKVSANTVETMDRLGLFRGSATFKSDFADGLSVIRINSKKVKCALSCIISHNIHDRFREKGAVH